MTYLLLAFSLAGGGLQSPAVTHSPGLEIVAAEFGTLGARSKLDIVQPLQRLCGPNSGDCSVFCSETSFGLYRLGRKPICRVTYRCPDRTTRSVEAAREEPILMRCNDDDADHTTNVAETLSPPPYVPPLPLKN